MTELTRQCDTDAPRQSSGEEAARLVVDSIPGLVALLTSGGEVEFANHHILEYTGQTLEELKGWGTNGTVHPEDLPHVVDVFTQSIGSGDPYEIVQRLRRSDGAYRWFQNSGFPLRDASGRIVRWCVLLTDIDDRKRAEDALRESERESRLIVDSIPGLIAAFTPGGEVEFVNRQILEYFGRTVEDLKRWGTGSTTHPEDLPRAVELFTQAVASGDPFEFEVPRPAVRWRLPLVSVSRFSASGCERTDRPLVQPADRHRRAQARRGGVCAKANASRASSWTAFPAWSPS